MTSIFFIQCVTNNLLDSVNCLAKGYQPQPSVSADNPYLDLDYSVYHKKLDPIIAYKSLVYRVPVC